VNLEEGASFFNPNRHTTILIKESTFWQPIDVDLKIGLTPKLQLPKLQVNSDVYIIPKEQNYYHWMIDVLPYIISIQEIDSTVTFLSVVHLKTYQIESLNEQMVTIKLNHVWVNATNLILPMRRHETGFPNHSVLKTLQEYFLNKFQPGEMQKVNKIYVSRRNSTRTPKNESEIEQILLSLGFQILDCNKLSLHDQFNAFHSAEIVIGPHGAGLTNLMFCQKGTKVIELIPSTFHNPCYEQLSSLSGLIYKAFPYDAFKSADRITSIVEESLT
jgi:capsular polysaccharide biosynthesis protein